MSEGLNASPINQVLLEQSLLGWGEFELEVMRDRNDNALVVCSIENIDPMGVHTGDSVTVAPSRRCPTASTRCCGPGPGGDPRGGGRDRRLQHPVRRQPGRRRGGGDRDEPARVALVGAGLEGDRVPDRQDRGTPRGRLRARGDPERHHAATPASFEPTIDYAVVKIPRFAFEKFPVAEGGLTTQMKSVGEVMAIGRTFKQAFMKALRSRELDANAAPPDARTSCWSGSRRPPTTATSCCSKRCGAGSAWRRCNARTQINPWFLDQFA